jgi:hypothetical protein
MCRVDAVELVLDEKEHGFRRVSSPHSVWEHPLQRCVANGCVNNVKKNQANLFTLRERI